MSYTLAQLRDRNTKNLPEHVQRITLDQNLLADVERLEAEEAELREDMGRADSDGNATKPPRKASEKVRPPRLDEVEAELAEMCDRIRASEGELLLRGVTGGEWQRWKDEHPPREDSVTDTRVGYGLVNASDLLEDLGRYVISWNGEALQPDDWTWFRDQIAAGDLRDIVSSVVLMHERSGVRAPKSLSVSSSSESGSPDYD